MNGPETTPAAELGLERLLVELWRRGVRLRRRGRRLDIDVPPGALTTELDGAMKTRRDELRRLLADPGWQAVEAALTKLEGEIVRTGPVPPIPHPHRPWRRACPACGGAAYSWAPAGAPWRRCHACGRVWNPKEAARP